MKWPVTYLVASVALLATATQSPAQTPDDIDPPDTQYQTGLDDIDPVIAARLPVKPVYRAFLPVAVDLSYRLPSPGNQGKAGSCTAWAVAYAARGYYTAALESRDVHLRKNIVSPNYVYTLAKQLQKKPACSPGTSVDWAVEVLKKGAVSLLEYPYHDSDCDDPPAAKTTETATDFRVRGFRLIDVRKIDDVKGALAQSEPVIIEFNSTPAWQHHRGNAVFNDTSVDEKKPGWHAMTLVGFDERKQAFRLINSWGTAWGDHGYAWLGYQAFSARVRRASVLDVAAPAPTPRPEAKPKIAEVMPAPKPVQPPAPVVDEKVKPVNQPKPAEPPKPVNIEVAPKPKPADLPKPAVGPVTPPHVNLEISDLATLACAKINVSKEGERNTLSGYVGSDSDLNLVKRVAASVPNTSAANVVLAPWPQCEALETLAKPLAMTDQPKIDIGSEQPRRAGDILKISVRSPAQISYVYVSYIQADGSVVHLVQPDGVVPQSTLPNTSMMFGDGQDGRATFTVSAPFGREMIIAIASRSPLFNERLPPRQTEREYLSALRKALIYKPSPDLPDRELTASIQFLQTEGK